MIADGMVSAITVHAANAGDSRAVLSSTKARPAAKQLQDQLTNNNKQGKSLSKHSLPNPELPKNCQLPEQRQCVLLMIIKVQIQRRWHVLRTQEV